MSTPNKVPELLLEQLRLGELSPEDEQKLRARFSAEELDARLKELAASDAELAERLPAEKVVSSIEGRVRVARAQREAAKKPTRTFMIMAPSVAALALAGLWVVRAPEVPYEKRPALVEGLDDGVRVKGLAPHLSLYRRHGDQVELLEDGARAAAGDMLQVGYVSADARFGVIVSLDGNGAVTLHFPDVVTGSTRLESDGERLLSHAYELDDAPKFERFFFVTGHAPIDVEAVLNAARSLAKDPARAARAKLALTPKLRQHTLTLVKESSR